MPRVKPGREWQDMVECIYCKHWQADQGKGATCHHCGASPLPSKAYPPEHPFSLQSIETAQAKHKAKMDAKYGTKSIEEMVFEREERMGHGDRTYG